MKEVKCPNCNYKGFYHETSSGEDECYECGHLLDVGKIIPDSMTIEELRRQNTELKGVISYISLKAENLRAITENIQRQIGRIGK